MQFMALGGAQEIGAACYYLEMAGKHFLVDCGTRHVEEADTHSRPFPYLDGVDHVDAVLITNAQLGRVGALQLALSRHPAAFCFMTIPTFPLAVTQYLSIARGVESGAPTHFQPVDWITEKSIERLSERVVSVKFDQAFHPFTQTPLTVTFIRAGYILGAGGILIEGEERSVFFTGDFTLANRRTLPGADFLERLNGKKLDLVVTEMTNAAREEYNIEQGEQTLFDTVARTIARGGMSLFPANRLAFPKNWSL